VIIGINHRDHAADNELMVNGRDLPWLQDNAVYNVWAAWHVVWRDVIILDADNRLVETYNLTDNDLGVTSNYAELEQKLLEAR
jgi:hypothetical protein